MTDIGAGDSSFCFEGLHKGKKQNADDTKLKKILGENSMDSF